MMIGCVLASAPEEEEEEEEGRQESTLAPQWGVPTPSKNARAPTTSTPHTHTTEVLLPDLPDRTLFTLSPIPAHPQIDETVSLSLP
jgi:hypothetical protein